MLQHFYVKVQIISTLTEKVSYCIKVGKLDECTCGSLAWFSQIQRDIIIFLTIPRSYIAFSSQITAWNEVCRQINMYLVNFGVKSTKEHVKYAILSFQHSYIYCAHPYCHYP